MSARSLLAAAFAVTTLSGAHALAEDAPVGYRDTPLLPGGRWHVHDPDRPQPTVVTPGADPAGAPSDAIVLFDGRSDAAFEVVTPGAKPWRVADGTLTVPIRSKGETSSSIRTREAFGDIQLHLEFRTPATVRGDSQERGNSGVILMGLYEVQVLDSYHNRTYADGSAGALYGSYPPLVNASRPPGVWQRYDIVFERPRFSASGAVLKAAYVTVFHNGVLIQNHRAFLGVTGHRVLAAYHAHPDALPLVLQDHGTPVSYRNIWVRRLALDDAADGGPK